jgi:cell division protein FtsI (penicillin-binding protein 3)
MKTKTPDIIKTDDKIETDDKNSVRRKKFWKFWIVMLFVNIGILVIVYRLFMIQIVNVDKYRDQARRQHESKVTLSAERGEILDRNSNIIASNFESISVAVDPTLLQSAKKIAEIIEKNLGIPRSVIMRKINDAEGSFAWIVRGKDEQLLKDLYKIKDKGLILLKEPRRIYHYGGISSQVIGITDIDNIGQSGIELQWDSLLIGRSGYMIMNRDGKGRLRPAADLPVFPAINGNSLKLTIDIELQRIVEYELKIGVENAQAESGTVVVIQPSTGEILAIASYPGYDPHSNQSPQQGAMRVRAITDIYEPGSTFKTITAAAAMEENIVKEDDRFNGYLGVYEGKGFTIRDVHPVGVITFREAMEHSSNIILSSVANLMPDNVFYKYIRDFGFGIKTGIDFPGEVAGKLPKPDTYVPSTKRYLGHGYGLAVSPLQIANAYAAIANNGVLMKPYIVKSIFNSEGIEIYSAKTEVVRRVISDKTAARVKDLLKGVVNNGTGKAVKMANLQICGKTGTSQQIDDGVYSKQHYTGSFAGFFPEDNPEIAMIVVIDKPTVSIYGGATAAPVFREIALRWASSNLGINSQINSIAKKSLYPPIDSGRIRVPNLVGLSTISANIILNNIGAKFKFDNNVNTIISRQFPSPGVLIPKKELIELTTANYSAYYTLDSALKHIEGLPLRSALKILNDYGVRTSVNGSGKVSKQKRTSASDGSPLVTLECK